jgi:hypothetical protein
MEIQAFLDSIRIEDNVVFLPSERIDSKVFQKEVKRPIENLGGVWNKERQGFVFPFDPSSRIKKLIAGVKISLRTEYHYFDTNIDLVGGLIHFAEENHIAINRLPRDAKVLEPSAGQGNIIKVLNCHGFKNIHYCELMPENREVLECELNRLDIDATFLGPDFLSIDQSNLYDLIIANPPFRHEVKHIKKMISVLKPGGMLLTISSPKLNADLEFEKFLNSHLSGWAMCELTSDKNDPLFEGTNIGCCFIVGSTPLSGSPTRNETSLDSLPLGELEEYEHDAEEVVTANFQMTLF